MIIKKESTMKRISWLTLLAVWLCAACEFKLKPYELNDSFRPIKVARYDRLQSRYLSTGDFAALQEMNTEYPVQVLMSDAEVAYADMEDINGQLNKSFERLREWLPDIPTPKVYAQIGALDQSIIIGDRSIGICLDKYLGANYPLYLKFYPYQQRVTMTRAHIVPDCLTFYLLSLYPMRNFENRKQMEKDLHIGKVMWVVNKSLGHRFFKTRYVVMVGKYMHKHPKTTIAELMEMDDYSVIRP